MDLDAIRQRAEMLSGETWGFVRSDATRTDGDLWTFSGSSDLVMALSEMPDDVADLLTALSLATARAAGLEAGIQALEWRKERTVAGTENMFCAWCHGSPSHVKHNPHLAPLNGHRKNCGLWALLAALAPAAGEGEP